MPTQQSYSLAQSLAQSLARSLIRSQALSFTDGQYTNTSPRYLNYYNPSSGLWEITSPFPSGVLANIAIGNKTFAQFESSRSSVNTYSEVHRGAISNWINIRSSVADNTIASPVATLTADTIIENTTPANSHFLYNPFGTDGSSTYIFTGFFKAKERDSVRLTFHPNGFPGSYVGCSFNINTGATANPTSSIYGSVQLSNGWRLCYVGEVSDAINTSDNFIFMENPLGTLVYDGDGTSGFYVWGTNVIKTKYLTSYVQTAATPTTREKDQFSWSEETIQSKASWIRNGLQCQLMMHQGTDDMLADDGGEKYLFVYDTTGAKGAVSLYLDGADKKLKWKDDDTGALGESAALDWSLGNIIELKWTLNDDGISTLYVNGGGVNTTYNGSAATAAVDGPLYCGMDENEANHADICLISNPEAI